MAAGSAEDIQELRNLLQAASRPHVRRLLESEIASLERLPAHQPEADPPPPPPPAAAPPPPLQRATVPVQTTYTTLSGFAWDQDDKSVKVYIFVEGASPERAAADFKEQSADLKLHDVGGKNLRLTLPKLAKKIRPEQSSVVIRPKRVTLNLKKADAGAWPDLQAKEEKLKKPKVDDKDPMSGIMDLMKNMYEDGDDEMRKTIAKAWSDSRAGTGPPFDK